jgi:phosphoribosylanthranilate isomerase
VTVIKICGIKTVCDAHAAIAAGADYLGFNFYPASPRYISPLECSRITRVIKAEQPETRLVGVFVDEILSNIQNTMRTCWLDLAQLHGNEPAEMIAQIAPGAYKAFRGVAGDVESFIMEGVPACLVDASVKGAYGGTGRTANWTAAARLASRYPIFLAGGLNPGNVAEAIALVRPWGVDVASGVENVPGVKDDAKMRAFVRAVNSTGAPVLHRENLPVRLENG